MRLADVTLEINLRNLRGIPQVAQLLLANGVNLRVKQAQGSQGTSLPQPLRKSRQVAKDTRDQEVAGGIGIQRQPTNRSLILGQQHCLIHQFAVADEALRPTQT
ncbi:hypothetical protein GALL_488710 [mine drainage metagenome]|uniref:Uncharacterized protein n=1 Tax=mine drainage metagenome TaxID=410659 RepID=A0A1J5PDU9_9ZZZZ